MRDGEEDFTAFVAARTKALARTAYLLTGNHHDAEDLVQVTLFKAAKVWKRIGHHPEPYVRRIMYNESVSGWRRRQRQPAERLAAVPPDSADRAAPDSATKVTLHQALARLTPKQRTILVLRYYEDLSEQQTADIMGTRLGTVKSQTKHALMRLRELAPELADLAPQQPDSSAVLRVVSGDGPQTNR
jgi:RNA polymerase sigma-70 factor (sigma-E family)